MFFVVDIKRSRLLTVTIDGRLDIWDFDATKHIIYKDQSVPNRPLILNNTTSFDSAFNLVENKDMPGICMTLTSQNMMVRTKKICVFYEGVLIYMYIRCLRCNVWRLYLSL